MGRSAIDSTIAADIAPLIDRPKNTSAPFTASSSVRSGRVDGVRGFPLVHARLAPAINDAAGVAQHGVFVRRPMRLSSSRHATPAAPAPLHTRFHRFQAAPGQVEGVDQRRRRDNRRPVLVVVEDRNVQAFAQALLDDETLRRLDVLEVDPAPALAEEAHAIDELVDVFGIHLEVDAVDVGKALEQNRLAFHHRLRRQRAEIARPQHRRAVGDHRTILPREV